MKGIIYAGLIILLMALILPVFAFSNGPPGLQKATCSFAANEQPIIIADQIFNADQFILKAQKSELTFTAAVKTENQVERKYLPHIIYKRFERSITNGDSYFSYRKARDAL